MRSPGKLTLLLTGVLFSPVVLADGYALRRVRPRDTIGTIAAAYNLSTEVLMAYNDLDGTLIHPGDLLKVPYVRATGGVAEQAPRAPASFREHVLQPGETLSEVAARYGIDRKS